MYSNKTHCRNVLKKQISAHKRVVRTYKKTLCFASSEAEKHEIELNIWRAECAIDRLEMQLDQSYDA